MTILQGTRHSSRTWFYVLRFVVSQKNGVSARGRQWAPGLSSYEHSSRH